MERMSPSIWETDDIIGVPESIFNQLPEEVRAPFEEIMKAGTKKMQSVEHELDSLVSLIKAAPTASSLGYISHRLRGSKFDGSFDKMMELEMMTTAFVVTYSRLFAKSNGVCVLQRKDLPAHLHAVHDDLRIIRNERYAHNGAHESIDTLVGFGFTGNEFHVNAQMSLGFHIGGRNEWEELIGCINKIMHEKLTKLLCRLKEKTGHEWVFPSGPPPEWKRETTNPE